MVVTKDSPNRRRSIAVAGHTQPSAAPRRRRAHSFAPKTSLSPQAKARRLLRPRKSILKQSFTPEDVEEETETMDFTQDLRSGIRDNAARKSLARRVSFAEKANVRLFYKPDNNQPPSPGSSMATSSEPDPEQAPPPPPQVNDENDYPNANFARRRRSSAASRLSIGSDMDMTTIGSSPNINGVPDIGAAILDEDFDDMSEMQLSDDMDVTQAIPAGIRRRSSVAGDPASRRETLGHPPSAILEMDEEQQGEADLTQSSIAEDSIISDAPPDQSREMEFTVPMGKSLRPPAQEDAAWLALRAATHSGDQPLEPEEESFDLGRQHSAPSDMPLGDAMSRLLRARDSLAHHSQQLNHNNHGENDGLLEDIQEEDTVSSMGSLNHDDDNGDRTINLTRRFSVAGEANGRFSMGYGETSMDVSEVYGSAVPAKSFAPPRPSFAPSAILREQEHTSQEEEPQLSVFTPPDDPVPPVAALPPAPQAITRPEPPFKVFQPPRSPVKSNQPLPSQTTPSKAKPTFSATFAPPVGKSTPVVSKSPAKKVPAKRPSREDNDIENIDTDQPSPAKRQAVSKPAKLADAAPAKATPLTPSKRSHFSAPTASSQAAQRPPAPRQSSGYMARRKSLAMGGNAQASTSQSPGPAARGNIAGRASMGSGPSDAWKRFDKTAPSSAPSPFKPTSTKGKEKEVARVDQEVEEPAEDDYDAVPMEQTSPVRMSPVRSPPRVTFTSEGHTTVEMSEVFDGPAFAENNEDDTGPLTKAERWRSAVEDGGYEEDDTPAISIAQFFDMTNIKFMDEIAAPRRSMHPGQQLLRRPRPGQEIGLSEYAVAMAIDIPQLELYTRVSRDLEGWMVKSKVAFAEAEEEATKVTPELFVEYSRADEDGQTELMHQLNFIKTNARGCAKSDWYDWKLKWVEGLKGTAENAFRELQADAEKLEALRAAANELVPDLEAEYAKIMAELEREQEEVAEIESSDQELLNDLKVNIAEQNIEVEALKAEVAEADGQLKHFKDRVRDIESQKQESLAAIAKAERVLQVQKSSTKAELLQLKDELDALETLHRTRIVKVNASAFEYIYDSTYKIAIPCSNFAPIIGKISITHLEASRALQKDRFPKLTNLFVACATSVLDEARHRTVRQVIQRLNDYWISCSQLRSHLRLLNLKYPVDVDVAMPSSQASEPPSLRAKALLMFPKVMGKAYVTFVFNLQTFSGWPLSIDSLDVEVDVAYGALDRNAILQAVVDRLAQATPSDNYALLDSCIDAQAL